MSYPGRVASTVSDPTAAEAARLTKHAKRQYGVAVQQANAERRFAALERGRSRDQHLVLARRHDTKAAAWLERASALAELTNTQEVKTT
jgi:hypothetical protein